jgi:hypothetical protein
MAVTEVEQRPQADDHFKGFIGKRVGEKIAFDGLDARIAIFRGRSDVLVKRQDGSGTPRNKKIVADPPPTSSIVLPATKLLANR